MLSHAHPPSISCPWVCARQPQRAKGVRLGARPSQTTAGYATVMRPLPGSTSQQSGSRDQLSPLTPDSTGMQQAADFLLSLAAGFFPGLEGINPASPGCPVHPTCPRPTIPSPTFPVSKRGKERRLGPDGREGTLGGKRQQEDGQSHHTPGWWPRGQEITHRAALTGPTQMTYFCCVGDMVTA